MCMCLDVFVYVCVSRCSLYIYVCVCLCACVPQQLVEVVALHEGSTRFRLLEQGPLPVPQRETAIVRVDQLAVKGKLCLRQCARTQHHTPQQVVDGRLCLL